MTKKKVWRYRCDHCGKSGCSGGHIKKHEGSCTRNPDRECGLCKEKRDYRLLVSAFKTGYRDLEWLRKQADNCPTCILTVIRQAVDPSDDETALWGEFKYKEELAEWWANKNALAAEENEFGLMASFGG